MTTDTLLVDVSRDWVLARSLQQRFMQGLEPAAGDLDYSARCRQMFELGGDCYDFIPREINGWRSPLRTLPARVWLRR